MTTQTFPRENDIYIFLVLFLEMLLARLPAASHLWALAAVEVPLPCQVAWVLGALLR